MELNEQGPVEANNIESSDSSESSGNDELTAKGSGADAEGHSLGKKTTTFPHLPGVYLFKDPEGHVLYVGKAIDLRKRVSSYFRTTSAGSVKTRVLLEKATDLEYVVTSNEKEALLLEASLIKKHRPKYNVILRDDKNYPALRIDPREPYPCIEVVRRFQKDGALYFGPYPSAYAVREILKLLNRLFPLRQCRNKRLPRREQPCLNFLMARCPGVCAGKMSPEEYRKIVEEIVLFLEGKTDFLQRQLQQRMDEASSELDYERAAFYRDRLRAIESMMERQDIVSDKFLDQDVLGIYQEENCTEIVILFIRQGTIIGQKYYNLGETVGEEGDILGELIQRYYSKGNHIPDEILVPAALEAGATLTEWLTELKGKKVHIWHVKRGDRKRLLEMAANNARERFLSRQKWERKDRGLLQNLQKLLKLPRLPERMACVDISNIQGRHAVGAVVVFDNGRPDKGSYRIFRIQGKAEPDDPTMMAETLERLFRDEQDLAASLDLLVLDGGKGQLNRIYRLMVENGMVDQLPLISIAKEREHERGELGRGFNEKIYIPGRKNPVLFTRYPDILHLLQRLRDEAHRFAVSRYQHVHRSELLSSELDTLPGVGPARRQALFQHFGSIEAIQQAGVEDLKGVLGIPEAVAERIVKYFEAKREE
jgi:excinuclease ABC subunit C